MVRRYPTIEWQGLKNRLPLFFCHGGALSPDSVCNLLEMYLHVVCVVAAMLCPQDLVCDWLQMQFLRRVVTGVNCNLLRLIDFNVLIREGECNQVTGVFQTLKIMLQ